MFKKYYIFIFFLIFLSIVFTSSQAFSVIELKYEGWEMEVKGSIQELYTDNLFFDTDEDQDAEWVTALNLNINTIYSGRRQDISLSGGINFWVNNDDFKDERVSEYVTLSYRRDLSEYHRFNLTNGFSHTRFPVTFEEEFGRKSADLDDYRNVFGLNYSRDVRDNLTVSTYYSNVVYWTSREEDVSRDSVQNTLRVSAEYQYNVATATRLLYSYSHRNFEGADNIFIHSVAVGLRRFITKSLYCDGNIGWQAASSDTESIASLVTLNYEVDEKSNASLHYSNTISTSNDGDTFDSWQISGDIDRNLLKDFNANLRGFYGEGEFESTGIEDKFSGASASLTYVIREDLNAIFSYTLSNLESNDEDREYTRNSISAGLIYYF
jgi:hypothetical protein